MAYVLYANILNTEQFGFQKNKPTYMPLLLLQENITKSMESMENIAKSLYVEYTWIWKRHWTLLTIHFSLELTGVNLLAHY